MWGEGGARGPLIKRLIGKHPSSKEPLQHKTTSATPSSQSDNRVTSGVDFSGCHGALSLMPALATLQAAQKFLAQYQTTL